MKEDFKIDVFCGAREVGETTPLAGIKPNAWLPYKENVSVFYSNGSTMAVLAREMRERAPDIVYINGIFLPIYNWLPLYLAKKRKLRVVLAPRGMLQQGALAIKPWKKKAFLSVFKLTQSHKDVLWHATDQQECNDIKKVFGSAAHVKIAPNIPKAPKSEGHSLLKVKGTLRLIYLSLITEKKNLLLALEALKSVPSPIQFDIYGPLVDTEYWNRCQIALKGQIHSITYLGPLHPDKVQDIISSYHAMILPTRGENFGHAIYEAFSVGTPVITSRFTPWGDLRLLKAGITVNSFVADDWTQALQEFIQMDREQYSHLSVGAHRLAVQFFQKHNFAEIYNELFTTAP